MNRRGFLASILAAAVAPAVVRAANLMPVVVRDSGVLTLRDVGADDTNIVTWFSEGGCAETLNNQKFIGSGTWEVPPEVTSVWITTIHGGGRGSPVDVLTAMRSARVRPGEVLVIGARGK